MGRRVNGMSPEYRTSGSNANEQTRTTAAKIEIRKMSGTVSSPITIIHNNSDAPSGPFVYAGMKRGAGAISGGEEKRARFEHNTGRDGAYGDAGVHGGSAGSSSNVFYPEQRPNT